MITDKIVFGYELGDEPAISLGDAYEGYLENPDVQTRQAIARSALQLYATSEPAAFNGALCAQLSDHLPEDAAIALEHPRQHQPDVPVAGEPYESLWATTRNIEIANDHAAAIGDVVDGVLLSGSTSWAPFYDTRAFCENPSDVDLLCKVQKGESVYEATARLTDAGLVSDFELLRAEHFVGAYNTDNADMFSLRSTMSGAKTSIHFLTKHTIDSICEIRLPEDGSVTSKRDFRPNMPHKAKDNGYEITHLDRKYSERYPANIKEVVIDGQPLGFLSSSPVHGKAEHEQGTSYKLGLIPFFLAVAPAIVRDPTGSLQADITKLSTKIAQLQEGRPIVNLPRLHRMPEHTIRHIGTTLTRGFDQSAAQARFAA